MPNFNGHFVEQQYLPDNLKNKRFYQPGDQGYEKQVMNRLSEWWSKRKEKAEDKE